MKSKVTFTPQRLRYLQLLAEHYPTVQSASTEIIKLRAILNLPKGTEHFMSDIHGEYDAFQHILHSASGEIKEKINEYFGMQMPRQERNNLATLIYYPESKLALVAQEVENMDQWYLETLNQLIPFCHFVSSKHTRDKVRAKIHPGYREIIDELLTLCEEDGFLKAQYDTILATIVEVGQAGEVIQAICELIQDLTCDHLHIVGDIFDRGPRADIVMDSLMKLPNVDIQWGNHDILWMGAASGSRTLVATVLCNSIRYNNLDVVETGYGISLRPLSTLANEVYQNTDTSRFTVKLVGDHTKQYSEKDKLLSARMYKAISIILLKLEGAKVLRHPEFHMEDRLLLDRINYETKTVDIGGQTYPLLDWDFPTIDPADPYKLTAEESQVIDQLTDSFRHSEKLQRHMRYLYSKGSLYKVHNGNLLFHGCVPVDEEGDFLAFSIGDKLRSGREFMDYADQMARKAYYAKRGTPEREFGMDFLWWLWCGRNSPTFGRDRMTTFERRLIADENTWTEPKNAYYAHYNSPSFCDKVLKEFGLEGPHCHIINGHVPVKAGKGESPIKGGGKLIVIDGGFSKAYQSTSGIAGYTLIFSSRYFRIVAHEPFAGRSAAIHKNHDIEGDEFRFEKIKTRMKVADTDEGRLLQERVDDLMELLEAFRSGAVKEDH